MIPAFHPFLAHFPPGLFVAGLILLELSRRRSDERLAGAAALNISLGFLAALVASFSGMISADLAERPTLEVEGHQGYSFLSSALFGLCTFFVYTRRFSIPALVMYALNLLALSASLYSGYALVFHPRG